MQVELSNAELSTIRVALLTARGHWQHNPSKIEATVLYEKLLDLVTPPTEPLAPKEPAPEIRGAKAVRLGIGRLEQATQRQAKATEALVNIIKNSGLL